MYSYLGATFLHSQKMLIFVCVVHMSAHPHHCGPGSIPRPGVTCGFSLLLVCVFAPRVFLRVLWFSSFHKNQHSKLQFNLETVNSSCSWFSLLLVCVFAPRVFLRVLWFSSFHKNQHSKLQFNLETVNRKSHPRGESTAKSSLLYYCYYCPTQERHSSSSLFKFSIFCKCTAGNLNRVSRVLCFFVVYFQTFHVVSIQLYASRDNGSCSWFLCHPSFLVKCFRGNDQVC